MNSFLTNLLSVCGIEYLIIDENFKILEMSLGLNHFADIPNEVKPGQDVRIIFPELEGLEDVFDAIRQGEQDSFELKGIMRSQDTGSPLYIDIRITNNIQEDHSRNRLIIVIEDATERMVLEIIVIEDATERMVLEQSLFQGANEANLLLRNLKASKQYIDQIVTSMADALLVTTLSGEIKKINYAAQVLLQYNEIELIGKPITKVIREVNKHPLIIGDIESIDISHNQDILGILRVSTYPTIKT